MPLKNLKAPARVPMVLCAGRSALENIMRVERLPTSSNGPQEGSHLIASFGSAGNAAISVSRLGGRSLLVSPLGGPAGEDTIGDQILAELTRNSVDCSGSVRVFGARSPASSNFVDSRNEQTTVVYESDRLAAAQVNDLAALVASADVVLADTHFREFILPICSLAKDRGIPVVVRVDELVQEDDALLTIASHVVWSSESLLASIGHSDVTVAFAHLRKFSPAFFVVTDGISNACWLEGATMRCVEGMTIHAVDTLGARDLFSGAFALALAEGRAEPEATHFALAATAIKCARFDGIFSAPTREEVEMRLGH